MQSYPESLKYGTTPATRAVVDAVLVANGAPTAPHVQLGKYSKVDLVLSETAGGTYDANIWWYYSAADVWVEDLAVGTISVTANGTAGAVLVPNAASAIYVEVSNFAGAGEANAWLIGVSVV